MIICGWYVISVKPAAGFQDDCLMEFPCHYVMIKAGLHGTETLVCTYFSFCVHLTNLHSKK